MADVDFSSNSDPVATYHNAIARTFQVKAPRATLPEGTAMDADDLQGIKAQYGGQWQNVPESLVSWYGNQGFPGYQLLAMIAQHWLVSKLCRMPAEDATRNGFEITSPGNKEVPEDLINQIKEQDIKYGLIENLVQFVNMGNVFGIRIAIFKVESDDPDYYLKPFNLDGVKPGSYRGIAQVDPYWATPELDMQSVSDPSSIDFYVPTWWRIGGKRYHKSHLMIFRGTEVADVLKPTYFYGGVSIPQKIYERVYASERTANEAPMLALTKRLTTYKMDMAKVVMNPQKAMESLQKFTEFRDNYGVKLIGTEEEMTQSDISLADLDSAIMTQFQLVCAGGECPATKVLGTTPKGFNATGEYDAKSYGQRLESIQEHYLTPFTNRHHDLVIRSDIGGKFSVEIGWKPVDSPTASELAELNNKKAQTDKTLFDTGAIDGVAIQERIINDPDSGYSNVSLSAPDEGDLIDDDEEPGAPTED